MKNIIAEAIERLDTALGHPQGCALLNRRMFFLYDEARGDFRVGLPSPVGRVYQWAIGWHPKCNVFHPNGCHR